MEYFDENDTVTLYEYYDEEERLVRVYMHLDGWHSATYVDIEMRNELVFAYTKKFNAIFTLNPNIQSILLIGAGGYSYPKYIISHYENISMDVVDNDPKAEEIAWNSFFLEDLYYQYHLKDTKRLNTIIDDGRHYIDTCTKKYDVIINDAYYGMLPVISLYTVEAFQSIKARLNPNGIFVANVPGYLALKDSIFLANTITTLKQVFKHVLLLPAPSHLSGSYNSNYVVFASDMYDTLEGSLTDSIVGDTIYYDKMIQEITDTYEY